MDLTGEYGDRNYVITRGDMRLTVTVALTEATTKLGRTTRFLIDNPGSPVVLAYALSKPLKYGGTYDAREGVYTFVLQEVNTTKEDNIELGIADYYKYHEGTDDTYQDASLVIDTENTTENGREVWL